MRSNRLSHLPIQTILLIWAILQFYPVLWLFMSSLKPSIDIKSRPFAFPGTFYTANYDFQQFTERGITVGTYFANSCIVTAISLFLITIVSLPAAYAIAKIRAPGRNLLLILFAGIVGIPSHAIVIPVYYLFAEVHLLNSYVGLALPYVALNMPFAVLLLQAYFRDFPDEILDAAKIDGAGHVRAFLLVMLPPSLGAVSSVFIISFINFWNEFMFSLVIMKNNARKTLPVGFMGFRGQYNVDWGPMMAAMSLAVIPPIIAYLFFHRNIIKGMTAGSIKG